VSFDSAEISLLLGTFWLNQTKQLQRHPRGKLEISGNDY
jgi:hypothetical protein